MALYCRKKLSAFLTEITLRAVADFYCLNYFHSYSTEKKLKNHYGVNENHDYCFVEMPKENNEILKYYHGETPMKVPYYLC